jgi:opacity protein-like surface antigen
MRRLTLLVLTCLLSLPHGVSATTKPRVLIHGDVAPATLPQSFREGFSVGLGGGIGMALPVSAHVALVADIDYVSFGKDDGDFREIYGVSPTDSLAGSQVSALYASLSVKFFTGKARNVKPYVFGGVGFFRYNPDDFTVNGAPLGFTDENAVGMHVGGGLEAEIAPYLGVFIDAFYVYGFTETPAAYVPMRVGIVFDWKAED